MLDSRMPVRKATPWLPTVAGSWPYSRCNTPIGWFWASVPGGTTSITGAKFRLMPAARSSVPQAAARLCSTLGAQLPCTTAEGIVEKPAPCIAWIRPPSWLAAMKKWTLAVVALETCAWTAEVTTRMPVTPAEVRSTNQTDPMWSN